LILVRRSFGQNYLTAIKTDNRIKAAARKKKPRRGPAGPAYHKSKNEYPGAEANLTYNEKRMP
jgi:hypothetical protein